MKSFQELRKELDEVNFKADAKKLEISRTKIKNTEVFYHSEKKGSNKVRVWVKPKSAKEPEELGVFKDIKTAKDSASQFVKLMGEDIQEGLDVRKRLIEQTKADDILKEINWLGEAKEMDQKDIDHIQRLTDKNQHTQSVLYLANKLKAKRAVKQLKAIDDYVQASGEVPKQLDQLRTIIRKDLITVAKRVYSNSAAIYKAF